MTTIPGLPPLPGGVILDDDIVGPVSRAGAEYRSTGAALKVLLGSSGSTDGVPPVVGSEFYELDEDGTTSLDEMGLPVFMETAPPQREPVRLTAPVNSLAVARTGQVLGGSNGTFTRGVITNHQYRYEQSDPALNLWAIIEGSTASTYTIASRNIGKRMRRGVRARNVVGWSAWSYGEVTAPVIAALAVQGTPITTAKQFVPYPGFTATRTGGASGGAWAATGLPTGMSIHPTTGVVGGTPTTDADVTGVDIYFTDGEGVASHLAPFDIVVASSVKKTLFLTAGQTTFTIPSDYVGVGWVQLIGPGGRGRKRLSGTGRGGGGAAFAKKAVGARTPGAVIACLMPTEGSETAAWWDSNTFVKAAAGINATDTVTGLGGKAADSIGDEVRSGGDGGSGAGGGGGGGAAGPHGAGANGGNPPNGNGAGGGAANGGLPGGGYPGTGGAARDGTAGGTGGTPSGSGSPGANGSGGGGGGENAGNGANGSTDAVWTRTSDGATTGPGSGGGGGRNSFNSNAGAGGGLGGAGGGCTDYSTAGVIAAGPAGGVFEYVI